MVSTSSRCLVAVLPHVAAMVAAEIHANDGDVLGWCDSRVEFEFTLDLLLDGLERQRSAALLQRRGVSLERLYCS